MIARALPKQTLFEAVTMVTNHALDDLYEQISELAEANGWPREEIDEALGGQGYGPELIEGYHVWLEDNV